MQRIGETSAAKGAPRAQQVIQHLRTGEIEILDLALPSPGDRQVLVQTHRTLISAGTERMLVEFGRAGLIGKARQQPERVRMVLDKVRTEGIASVVEAVSSKLEEPLPLGYANVGSVVEVGRDVHEFRVGDRVVSNAPHATFARVGVNLCARVPVDVTDDEAVFTVPAAIGMQGVRLAEPTLGETFAVIGSGLIGLLTVQLLIANGCRVITIDVRADRLALAAKFGAVTVLGESGTDAAARVLELTAGRGVDGVLITAATNSDRPVSDAARMTRKRGRIILVGVSGLHLSRAEFYQKELRFQVSCSYGPGRYDEAYEVSGHDYPLPFVRWTEQRNFEAVGELLASRRLHTTPLTSHHFDFERAADAYNALLEDPTALGIVLKYRSDGGGKEVLPPRVVSFAQAPVREGSVVAEATGIAMIGAGAYARRFLLPALKESGARLTTLISTGSPLGAWAARRSGFSRVSTDPGSVIDDPQTGAVVIATRHDSHASYVCQMLRSGKHVFVEKPLALSEVELREIDELYAECVARGRVPVVMVGFNRRFAPLVIDMKRLVKGAAGPRSFIYTVNAGVVQRDHWVHDPVAGGGRIVGEACHFIDLLRFLADSPISGVSALPALGSEGRSTDTASIALSFANGSIGSIHYFTNGSRSFPKERLEVFAGGGVLKLDNFRSLESFSWPGFRGRRLWRQDKGNRACIQRFVDATRGGAPAPIPFPELVEVSRASIDAARQVNAT